MVISPGATHRSVKPGFSHCFYKDVDGIVHEWRSDSGWSPLYKTYRIDDATRWTPIPDLPKPESYIPQTRSEDVW